MKKILFVFLFLFAFSITGNCQYKNLPLVQDNHGLYQLSKDILLNYSFVTNTNNEKFLFVKFSNKEKNLLNIKYKYEDNTYWNFSLLDIYNIVLNNKKFYILHTYQQSAKGDPDFSNFWIIGEDQDKLKIYFNSNVLASKVKKAKKFQAYSYFTKDNANKNSVSYHGFSHEINVSLYWDDFDKSIKYKLMSHFDLMNKTKKQILEQKRINQLIKE